MTTSTLNKVMERTYTMMDTERSSFHSSKTEIKDVKLRSQSMKNSSKDNSMFRSMDSQKYEEHKSLQLGGSEDDNVSYDDETDEIAREVAIR